MKRIVKEKRQEERLKATECTGGKNRQKSAREIKKNSCHERGKNAHPPPQTIQLEEKIFDLRYVPPFFEFKKNNLDT